MSRRAVRPLNQQANRQANRQFYEQHPERDPARGGSGIHPTAREDAPLRTEWMEYYEAAGGEVEEVPRRDHSARRMTARCNDSWIHFIVMDQETERRLPDVVFALELPNGDEQIKQTNQNGEVRIENIPEGNCTIKMFETNELVPLLLEIQEVEFSVQRMLTIAETTSQEAPPEPDETAEDEDSDSGEPTEESFSARTMLLQTCGEVNPSSGDDLESVANLCGFSDISELLNFNFGRQENMDAVQHALMTHIGVNEDSFDDEGNLVFSGSEDPGIFYHPLGDESQYATELVHIIKVSAIQREFPLELETVDEVGHPRPNQQLQLIPTTGEPILVETNDEGYWSTGDERLQISGLLEVQLRDGTVLHFPDQGQFRDDIERPPAIINPLHVFSAITPIVVPRLDETRRSRRTNLRRRYEEVSDERLQPAETPEEEREEGVSEEESPPMQPRRRRFRNSVDNVWIQAGIWDEGGEPDLGRLHECLTDFLGCYHVTAISPERVFYTQVVSGPNVWFLNPQGEVAGRFTLRDEVRFGNFGGFFTAERSNDIPVFVDFVEEAYGITRILLDGEVTSVGDLSPEDRIRYANFPDMVQPDQKPNLIALRRRYARHVQILYILPSSRGMWHVMARHGGCGFLEEYPNPDEQSDRFNRIHQRNLEVMENITAVYRGYLDWYRDQVEGIPDRVEATPAQEDSEGRSAPLPARCEAALRRLGPPDSPFRFPMPATLDLSVEREHEAFVELAHANNAASSYQAWVTISEVLDEIWNRQSGGSIRFIAEFEAAPGARLHVGPDVRERAGGAEASARVGYSRYAKLKFKTNVSLDPNQGLILPGAEDLINIDDIEIGHEFGGEAAIRRNNEVVLGGAAQVTRSTEIEVSTRDFKNAVGFNVGLEGGGREIGISGELCDNGDYRITVPSIVGNLDASGNVADGNSRVGVCWNRDTSLLRTRSSVEGSAAVTAEGKICVGVRIQLLRSDTVLAVVSNAPGFFERLSWEAIVRPGVFWNHLPENVQEGLFILGWTDNEIWDERHSLREDQWPDIPRTRWVDLTPEQTVAAVHLGLNRMQGNARQSWTAAWGRITGYPGIQGGLEAALH